MYVLHTYKHNTCCFDLGVEKSVLGDLEQTLLGLGEGPLLHPSMQRRWGLLQTAGSPQEFHVRELSAFFHWATPPLEI